MIEIDWNPDAKKVRAFGVGLFLFGAALLALRGWEFAAGAWSLGALTLAVPAWGRRLYQGWMGAAFLAGTVLSNLLLAVVFYGIVTPVALARRLLGADPLALKPGGGSLWKDLPPVKDKSRYERLY